jgi:penicillin-binding protein 1C
MSENQLPKSPEDPRERFRRLLEEAEKTEQDVEASYDFSDQTPKPTSPAKTTPSSVDNRESDQGDSGNLSASYVSVPQIGTAPDSQEIEPDHLDDTQPSDTENLPTLPQDESTSTPPPPLGTTPQSPPPALDTRGMPLPRRVNEIDAGATQVTPVAYQERTSISSPQPEPPSVIQPVYQPREPVPARRRIDWSSGLGCVLRMAILGIFSIIALIILAGSFMLYQYYSIVSAEDWPDVGSLYQNSAQFETTRILDRNGNVLYEILDPTAGRRSYVPLEEMSPYLVAATIATEDKLFYSNPGFDPMGILRAFWQNFNSSETVSGASTITQQITRLLLMDAEERGQRTYMRKLREALLAEEVTRRYTKDEILELYLNEIYYGNMAYGIEAAAQTYFGTSARSLNLAQASFLAGLPQLPAIYDPYSNREAALARQEDVLLLMFQASQEQDCIFVSNNQQEICIDVGEAALASQELDDYEFKSPDVQIRYPHWVNFVRSQLEEMYDPSVIYRSGFDVYTTLDPGLQDAAQKVVSEQVEALANKHVTNGALVLVRPSTGEILAMVGSADFYDESIDGQVNMAISPRQPGSSIKPLTYAAAFEKGWTASTLIWDVQSEFPPSGDPNDPRPPYKPVNYDERFHGPVLLRSALANSYNVPAVKALEFVGIYDNPNTPEEDGLVAMARRLGITTLTRNDYGLSLTLGGGDVSLLEMTGAYAVFANGGRKIPPVSISRIIDHQGNIVFEYSTPPGEQAISSEHAYLISSILSDNQARTPAFGSNSVLNIPFPAAAKTGTTNDFRDNWTVGYTPDIVVGTWVGNADYTPMQGTSGLTGAAPIWASFMQTAIQQTTGGNPSSFVKPAGIVERVICSASGTEPSQWCPSQTSEIFAADQLPLAKGYDLWQKATIDTWTGLLASPDCNDFTENKMALNISDPWAIKWIKENSAGRSWAEKHGFSEPIFFAPTKACSENDPRPILSIASPDDGDLIDENPLDIYGQADATDNFYIYRLEYGRGDDPVDWEEIHKKKVPVDEPEKLYEWDVSEIEAGLITLRLYMESTEDTYAEVRIQLDMQVPTPTPTSTPTPTITPSPTWTPTPTVTPSPTQTIPPSETPTSTPVPIFTNTPTPNP